MGFADITNAVLEFVRQHPNWAAFVVFALSFGESLPFISLILPYWAVLVGIGTIIAVADPLIFWTIVAAAAIGAALGDWLSSSSAGVGGGSSEEPPQASGQGLSVPQIPSTLGVAHIELNLGSTSLDGRLPRTSAAGRSSHRHRELLVRSG